MSSVSAEIKDAIVDRLNDAVANSELSQTFTATRTPLPNFDEKTLGTLRVVVMTAEIETERLTRTMKQQRTSVAINVMKRVGFEDGEVNNAAVDELEALVEEISDLMSEPLEGFEKAGPTVPVASPPYDPEMLQLGIFAGAVVMTYTTTRAMRTS